MPRPFIVVDRYVPRTFTCITPYEAWCGDHNYIVHEKEQRCPHCKARDKIIVGHGIWKDVEYAGYNRPLESSSEEVD